MFMPSPRTEEQRLLVQNVGESPASRLLLIAICPATSPRSSPQISKKLAAALAATPNSDWWPTASRRRWPFPRSCSRIAT